MIYKVTPQGIVLSVRITPNAGKTEVKGVFIDADGGEFLKISVVSIPEKGKANQELIKFLSKSLKLAKTMLMIISGETSHLKKVLITADESYVLPKLREWSGL
ncbi:MAG: DUF167 domain-containing protein [Alphaproteobacteria bacterium]|nr:DUF167 domain-containing protein [Alphaproteobacteria bacterium]